MNRLLDYRILVPLALLAGLAPFHPQPHLVEKLGMLLDGRLQRPIDLFDLAFHGWPFVLLAWRVARDARERLRGACFRRGRS